MSYRVSSANGCTLITGIVFSAGSTPPQRAYMPRNSRHCRVADNYQNEITAAKFGFITGAAISLHLACDQVGMLAVLKLSQSNIHGTIIADEQTEIQWII